MTLTPGDAVLAVLDEAGGDALHWTVVWDRALRAGYLDPRTDPEARDKLMRELATLARSGRITKTSTGTYCRPETPGAGPE